LAAALFAALVTLLTPLTATLITLISHLIVSFRDNAWNGLLLLRVLG
jgi:hypothetical protein